jgi:hypothetical protein
MFVNKYRILFMVVVLVFASLACQALNFGGDVQESNDVNAPSSSDPENPENGGNGSSADSDYPMTVDAYNVLDVGDGSILYYTRLSLDDVMGFYRAEYESRGYTENELLTVKSDGVFSMVFNSHPSGKAVVIQSVDLGDGSRSVTIRLEGE